MNIVKHLSLNWNKSGIEKGDTVLIHSNISPILRNVRKQGFKLTLEDIFDSFLDAVGKNGTLLFPLFNFEFKKSKYFSILDTRSEMGSLTEYVRKNKNIIRTGHPIYSFGVIGAKENKFKDVNNVSGYGKDSPFAILTSLDGKIAVLGLNEQRSMTYYHYVEECLKVKYRYYKIFSGNYVDINNDISKVNYKIYVRNISAGVKTNVEPMGNYLWKLGLYKGFKFNQPYYLRSIRAQDIYRETEKIIKMGKEEKFLISRV